MHPFFQHVFHTDLYILEVMQYPTSCDSLINKKTSTFINKNRLKVVKYDVTFIGASLIGTYTFLSCHCLPIYMLIFIFGFNESLTRVKYITSSYVIYMNIPFRALFFLIKEFESTRVQNKTVRVKVIFSCINFLKFHSFKN